MRRSRGETAAAAAAGCPLVSRETGRSSQFCRPSHLIPSLPWYEARHLLHPLLLLMNMRQCERGCLQPAAHSPVYTEFTVHTLRTIRQIQKRSKLNFASAPVVQRSHRRLGMHGKAHTNSFPALTHASAASPPLPSPFLFPLLLINS